MKHFLVITNLHTCLSKANKFMFLYQLFHIFVVILWQWQIKSWNWKLKCCDKVRYVIQNTLLLIKTIFLVIRIHFLNHTIIFLEFSLEIQCTCALVGVGRDQHSFVKCCVYCMYTFEYKLHVCLVHILIHFRLICRSSVKWLCLGKRMFTTSFVLLNAPPSALDTEQHCGIGYRRKASRKNCKDDGECASICSPNSSVQSASIHQVINDYLSVDIPQCHSSTSVPFGWRYFVKIAIIFILLWPC